MEEVCSTYTNKRFISSNLLSRNRSLAPAVTPSDPFSPQAFCETILPANVDISELELSLKFRGLVWPLRVVVKINKKLNLWFTVPKGATPVNQTSAADWQMPVRWDNVISIMLRQV